MLLIFWYYWILQLCLQFQGEFIIMQIAKQSA